MAVRVVAPRSPHRAPSKSQDITEYCDRCRRQQWSLPIVGGSACVNAEAADGATNVVVPFFVQKGTRPKRRKGGRMEVGKSISRGAGKRREGWSPEEFHAIVESFDGASEAFCDAPKFVRDLCAIEWKGET